MLTREKDNKVFLQVKTIKNQEHHDYEGILKILNSIYSCLTCQKSITTLYIENIQEKN
jgi:hypothetical protein